MRFLLFTLFINALCFGSASEKARCSVCAMFVSRGAKTSFEGELEGKKFPLCSFQCAHRTHQKYPAANFQVFDFLSGKPLDANKAFFLAKSKNVLREVEFDMPPTVVAFSSEEKAKATQKRLGDGVIVYGLKELEKLYE